MKNWIWKDGDNVITVNFMGGKVVNRTCHLVNKAGMKVDQNGFPGQ